MTKKQKSTRILKLAKKLKLINLKGGKCEVCGESRIGCLSFHHTNPKEKITELAKLTNYRLSLSVDESEKCILLCVNCHQMLHMKTQNRKQNRFDNKKILLDFKNTEICFYCNNKLNVDTFHFHHLRDKKYLISRRICNLVFKNVNDIPEDLKLEVNNCECVCANCHFNEHFDDVFYEEHYAEIFKKSQTMKEVQSKLDKELVRKMFEDGMKQIDIAKYFNASKGTICGILKSFGLTIPTKDKKKRHVTEIIEFREQGLSYKEIGKILNLRKATVWMKLNT